MNKAILPFHVEMNGGILGAIHGLSWGKSVIQSFRGPSANQHYFHPAGVFLRANQASSRLVCAPPTDSSAAL